MTRRSSAALLSGSVCFLLTILPLSSCRSSLRAGTEAGDLVTVTFKLTGMNSADKARSDLLYSLATCGSGAASGTLNPDASVSFQTRGIRKGDKCDLLVKSGSARASDIEWFSEPGILYRGVNTMVTSTEGRFNGTAVLQQMYTHSQPPGSKLWKLAATFKAPAGLNDLCTCLIDTNPAISNNVSKVESAGATSGKCAFVNAISPALTKVECGKLVIQCGATVLRGSWPAATIVDGSTSAGASLPELTLEPGTPDDISDATIDVVIPR